MIHHIGLMGTHGTGKSTYAMRLAKLQRIVGNRTQVITEVARRCPYPINQNTSEEAQLWIFHRQIIEELEAMRHSTFIICDRTILDGLTYAEHAGLSDVVDACMPMALMWLEKYTKIYWFRPAPGRLVADGFRDMDPVFQGSIDRIFLSWIEAYNINVKEVSSCTPVQSRRENSWPPS